MPLSGWSIALLCQDMQRRHGEIDGGSAVLALGRLGVGMLTARSDLDLVMVYKVADNAESNGARSIGASAYFARLTQTFVSWLSSASAEGSLYEVDMRLRPDGEKEALRSAFSALMITTPKMRGYGKSWRSRKAGSYALAQRTPP